MFINVSIMGLLGFEPRVYRSKRQVLPNYTTIPETKKKMERESSSPSWL